MVQKKRTEDLSPSFGDGIQIVRITFGHDKHSFSMEEDGLIGVQPPTKNDPTWKVFLPNDKIQMFHGMPVAIVAYRTYEQTVDEDAE